MARSFNQFTVSGNLGKDPELTYSQNGVAVTRGSMAINCATEKGEETTWLRWVAFNSTAEHLNEWAMKGTGILFSGELRFKTWTRDDGTKVPQTELIVSNFKIIGKGRTKDEVVVSEVPEIEGEPF